LAAGSLLDFAIEEVGIPVGRIESLYVYPMSFFEFLIAYDELGLAQTLLQHDQNKPMEPVFHSKLMKRLGEYMAVGGMPEAVRVYIEEKNPLKCFKAQSALLDTYRQDFNKYAMRHQIKYLEMIFNTVPRLLAKRFKYNAIHGEYRKRELAPALDLLITAGVVHRVYHSDGQGIPLHAQIDPECFKTLFLDVGLAQNSLGVDVSSLFLSPETALVNKGEVTEAFVGQELLAYAPVHAKANLYYWQRHAQASSAEVDYLVAHEHKVLPLEVKSGPGSTLKSLHMFLLSHPESTRAIRFSVRNYSTGGPIQSLPLYAVVSLAAGKDMLTRMLDIG
jgi:uncharacterized protein